MTGRCTHKVREGILEWLSNLYGEGYRITTGVKMTAIYRAIIHF